MKVGKIDDTEDHITEDAVRRSATKLIPGGSVVVVTRSGILEHSLPTAITGVDATINQDLKAITTNACVIPEYLSLSFQAFEQDILSTCRKAGTTVASIEFPKLLDFAIPLAPLAEQRRIVAEIETQFTRLDAAAAAGERLRLKLSRYRAAVRMAACSGQLVPTEAELARKQERDYEAGELLLARMQGMQTANRNRRRRNLKSVKDVELTDLPEGWVWTTMPQIGEINRGVSKHRPRNDRRLLGGSYPFIQTSDVRQSSTFIRNHSQSYSEFGLAQSRLWPAGTLCITIAANIAETSILTFPACFPDSIVGFVSDGDPLITRFLQIYIETVKERLERFAPATAQKNINLETLSSLAIPLPPLAEQHRIVTEVERCLSSSERVESIISAVLRRIAKLRQAILRQAFEGELVPQDPNDEPAVALLDRIQAEQDFSVNGKRPARQRRTPLVEKQHALF